ncbi:hypothetical protein [Tunicatimonas pelagia]|uniref:hypothetical protein n=1 Tax=Tunicatimonas pelagia TaxID=931531 RepID=UPI00266662B2|nr:hypothetical protein [Tunicatimonas pelagia]WKN42728.1 hypothetical protein P0M28_27195 [Tunicatimonas pelagia]
MKVQQNQPLVAQKVLLLTIFLGAYSSLALAQTAEDSIKNTIEQLFAGMRTADSAQVRSTLASEVRLITVVNTSSLTHLQETSVDRFLQAVGSPHDEVWDERVQDYHIRVDDALATAWTPYRFYRGSTFSHCGVNAFQLYRGQQGWKIIQITDTRRKRGCAE